MMIRLHWPPPAAAAFNDQITVEASEEPTERNSEAKRFERTAAAQRTQRTRADDADDGRVIEELIGPAIFLKHLKVQISRKICGLGWVTRAIHAT